MKYIILAMGILLTGLVAEVTAQQLPATMVVKNRFVNVRKGPGTGYDQVGTLYRGDHVEAERKYRNWYRIVLDDGRIGWVREDLVEPFDPAKVPLTDEQADSLKAVVDTGNRLITAMEDSSRAMLAEVRNREDVRDSLMSRLGLQSMPPADTLIAPDTTSKMNKMPEPLPGNQASVMTMKSEEPFPRRWEFTPRVGVLLSDNESLIAGGMSVSRNFTREFAWTVNAAFARKDPATEGSLQGDYEHFFVGGGLNYSYGPGRIVVPYLELGAGGVYTQAADSSFTALDLFFGAGFHLFLTPDFALTAGYQGHGMMAEGNRLMHLVTIGGTICVPPYTGRRPGWPEGQTYIAPYAAWQVYSRRFSMNASPSAGLLAGRRIFGNLAAEFMGGWQPLAINDGLEERTENSYELIGRVLYYPWGGYSGPYVTAGGGALLLGGDGRPPEDTTKYGMFLYGAGVNLACGNSVTLTGEMLHLVFPDVVPLAVDSEVGAGSALRVGMGLRFGF